VVGQKAVLTRFVILMPKPKREGFCFCEAEGGGHGRI
jgi:hypothetical protein